MKVNPINNVNYNNLGNVNFSGKKKDNSQNSVTDIIRSKAATVPVVVLLAANPATLNSAIPAQPLDGAKIVQIQSPKAPKAEEATYTAFPDNQEVQQNNKNYNSWSLLIKKKNEGLIHYDMPILIKDSHNTNDWVNARLIFTTNNKSEDSNGFDDIYLITDGEKGPSEVKDDAPSIIGLTLHENEGNDFITATVDKPFIKDGQVKTKRVEVRLKNSSANKLVDILQNDTGLKPLRTENDHSNWQKYLKIVNTTRIPKDREVLGIFNLFIFSVEDITAPMYEKSEIKGYMPWRK